MTEHSGDSGRYIDSDHMVETPESLRDSDPESPPLDRGGDESDTYLAADRYGITADEQRHGEPHDLRLSEEEPDEGTHPDLEKDAVSGDVGRDGGDRSAEEAAMHVVDEP